MKFHKFSYLMICLSWSRWHKTKTVLWNCFKSMPPYQTEYWITWRWLWITINCCLIWSEIRDAFAYWKFSIKSNFRGKKLRAITLHRMGIGIFELILINDDVCLARICEVTWIQQCDDWLSYLLIGFSSTIFSLSSLLCFFLFFGGGWGGGTVAFDSLMWGTG